MAKLAQPVDELRSDEPAAADDYDVHVHPFGVDHRARSV
jgi:hypothetical protein